MADVTTTGTDAIYHEWKYVTGMKVSKILVHRFYFVYFYHPCHCGFAHGYTHMVPNIAGSIHKTYYVTCVCISGEPCAIYPVHQVALNRGVGSKFGLVRQILCQSNQHSVQLYIACEACKC